MREFGDKQIWKCGDGVIVKIDSKPISSKMLYISLIFKILGRISLTLSFLCVLLPTCRDASDLSE
jgi:hypothetical protein